MITAIIAAAGSGKRMGRGINKLFIPLNSEPILAHTIRALAGQPDIQHLIVAAAVNDIEQITGLLQGMRLSISWQVVVGGEERQDSIRNALAQLPAETDYVLVHDGARPFADEVLIKRVVEAAEAYGSAIAAVPVKDTIKRIDSNGFVEGTPDRSALWAVQTPQVFRASILVEAYRQAQREGVKVTDDAGLVERSGHEVKIVEGSYTNMKITTPEDVVVAKAIMSETVMPRLMHFGFGYDVHRFAVGRDLMLGGVRIPHEKGLDGHSDADVLLHAVSDALLGAAGMGDIGKHFSDKDPQYKGISSLLLLGEVRQKLEDGGYMANNVDAVVVAEKPKIAPYTDEMCCKISQALGISPGKVNVKGTTTEGLGFAGRGEGIASYAVVSIVSR